jgi:hypothetical protein
MSHIHWVARQNKLEIPRDKDEVNKREIHEYDGRTHDPDTKVVPLTPKPTRTVEVLVREPSTIVSCREEDAALRKWPLPRYCCASCILETKTKVGSTAAKAPAPRIKPKFLLQKEKNNFFQTGRGRLEWRELGWSGGNCRSCALAKEKEVGTRGKAGVEQE